MTVTSTEKRTRVGPRLGGNAGGRTSLNNLAVLAVLVVVLIPLPLVLPAAQQAVAVRILIFALMGVGWNLMSGFGGMFSFGHAAYFGIGAYSGAWLLVEHGVSPWIGMVVGAALAALFGRPAEQSAGYDVDPLAAALDEIFVADGFRLPDSGDVRLGVVRISQSRIALRWAPDGAADDSDLGAEDEDEVAALRRALDNAPEGPRRAEIGYRLLDGACGLAERDPLPQVEADGNGRKLALMGDRKRLDRHRRPFTEHGQRHLAACYRRFDVDLVERVDLALQFGQDLHHHVIAVDLREILRDLPLAEGIIERIVDQLRLDSVTRRGIAIDGQR